MRRLVIVCVCAVAVLTALVGAASPAVATNDPFFARQWALEQIGAPRAWTVTRGAGVLIGVIDSGVDVGHPDLANKIAGTADCAGKPCVENGGGVDPRGHGTSVTGVAVANADNGLGVAGVAPDAKVLVAKVMGPAGEATVADLDAGIRWAVARGARVINVSLGDANFASGNPLRDSVEFAWSRGAVPVLASGNFGNSSQNYGTINALVVGAVDRAGSVASYSSPIGNAKWGLVAPGGSGASGADNNIISTAAGGGYSSSAGTSMAAPHVSAAIALLLAQGLSPAAAVSRLLATLDRVACGTGCQGRLNLASAVGAGPAAAPPVTSAPATTPQVTTPRVTVPRVTTPRATVPPVTKAPVPRPSAVTVPTVAPASPTTTMAPRSDVVPAEVPTPGSASLLAARAGGLGEYQDANANAAAKASLVGLALLMAFAVAAATAWVGRRLQA